MSLTKEESALRAWVARLGRAFGLSKDDYYAIRELQDGQCPICGKEIPDPADTGATRRSPVDHDHKSGEVRGIPCEFCNRKRIGQWNSGNVDLLRRVLEYVENPPARRLRGIPLIVPGHGKRKRRTRAKTVS
jgi:Recombination endonuclease VII